jgi:hypothetical protein
MTKTYTTLLIMTAFIVAKAFGVIELSWWLITSPVWIVGIYLVLTGGVYTFLDYLSFRFSLLNEYFRK